MPFLDRWSARKRGGGVPAEQEAPPLADLSPGGTDTGAERDDTAQARLPTTCPPRRLDRASPLPSADDVASSTPVAGDARLASIPHDADDTTGTHDAQEIGDGGETLLTDSDMPPLGTLDHRSDLSIFFNRGVSSTLRKAALRRVFSLPAYNVRDGLDDYDGDYTRFEPLGDVVTCDMKHAAERLAARQARSADAATHGAEPVSVAIDGPSGDVGSSGYDTAGGSHRIAARQDEADASAGEPPPGDADESAVSHGMPEMPVSRPGAGMSEDEDVRACDSGAFWSPCAGTMVGVQVDAEQGTGDARDRQNDPLDGGGAA